MEIGSRLCDISKCWRFDHTFCITFEVAYIGKLIFPSKFKWLHRATKSDTRMTACATFVYKGSQTLFFCICQCIFFSIEEVVKSRRRNQCSLKDTDRCRNGFKIYFDIFSIGFLELFNIGRDGVDPLFYQ